MRQRQNHYTDLKKTMDTANDLYQHYHPKDFQKLGIAAAAGDRASERMLQEHVGYARIIVDNYETLGPGSQGDVNGSLMQSIESGIFTDQKEISEIQQAWAKIEELYRDIAGPKLKNWEDNVQTDPDTLIAPTKLRYSHPLVRAVWRGVEYISPEWLHQKVFEDERKFAKKGIAKNSHENEEAKSFNQRMMDSIVNDTEIEAESDGGTARKEPGVLSQLRDDYNKKHEEQWPDTQAILENQKPGKSISLQYQDITHRDNFNILAPSSELKNLQVIDNQNGILLKGKRDKTDVLVYISDKNVGIDKRIAGDSENPDQNPPKTELQNTSGKMAIIDRDKVQETDPNTLNIQNYISKAKLGICMNPVPSDLYRKDSLLRETWKQNKQT